MFASHNHTSRTGIFAQNCLVLLVWQQLCWVYACCRPWRTSMQRPLSRVTMRDESVQTRFRAYPAARTKEAPLETTGDLCLDLGTSTHRETFPSILTPLQTYLSTIAVLSCHCAPCSHVPFLIVLSNHRSCARITEKPLAWALQKSSSENWHGLWFEE
jgi:hypothetical protein